MRLWKSLAAAALALLLGALPASGGQATYTMPLTGPSTFADFLNTSLNPALAAVLTQNSGATAPAVSGQPGTYQWWADTSGSPVVLKFYDGTSWIAFLNIDTAAHTVQLTGASVAVTGSTAPTNGLYLPAANTLGLAANSAGEVRLTSSALSPNANDGSALGTSSLGWSDAFYATGAVWDIGAGNWIATHTSGILTVGTGDLRVTSAGTNTASVATVGGTQTLTSKTLTSPILNTPTVGTSILPTANDGAAIGASGTAFSDLFLASGAVIDYAAGNWVATHTSGVLTVGTGDLRVTNAGTNAASAVTVGGTQTLTSKTLTSPVLNTPTVGTSILPSANDGAPLGASGTAFSDLFLASGGVINWNAGDVTVTHAANALAFAGASSGYSFDAVVQPSANDAAALGAAATSWSDLFLASGGVINIANGNWVATHTSGILTVGTGDLRITSAGTNAASAVTVDGTQTLGNKTLTTPVLNGTPTGTGVATAATASTLALRDANADITADNFIQGYATTATAAGTTTLTVDSPALQFFTGSTTQNVDMPVASTVVLGQSWTIVNKSSGVVTVRSSGGNSIQAVAAGNTAVVTNILTSGTSAASWHATYISSGAGTGTVTSITAGTGLTGGTITTSGTIDLTVPVTRANGGTQSTGGAVIKVVRQVFTADGTYTPTTGMLYAEVEVVGGGGGGGGVAGTTTGHQNSAAGGGGGGAYAKKVVTAADIGASKAVDIGAGGGGGASGNNNGSAGASTTLGTTIVVAAGGSAGTGAAVNSVGTGGAAGTTGTGDYVIPGEPGTSGLYNTTTTTPATVAAVSPYMGSMINGGNSGMLFGQGGRSTINATGSNATGYGGGGAGAHNAGGGGALAGGDGTSGIMIITEYVNQ